MTDIFGFPNLPINALELIGENHALYVALLRDLDLKRISFDLRGNRTHKRYTYSTIAGCGRHTSSPTVSPVATLAWMFSSIIRARSAV
jgi:hypothetical protein